MFAPSLQTVLMFAIVAVVFLGMMATGVFLFVQVLRRNAGGSWKALARRFAAEPPSDVEQVFQRETVQVGLVRAKWCATVGVGPRGLSLKAPWTQTILIPWDEVKATNATTLYFRSAYALTIGAPPVATVTVLAPAYRAIWPYLGTRRVEHANGAATASVSS